MTLLTATGRRWGARTLASVTAIISVAVVLTPAASSDEPGAASIPLATSLQSAAGTWATFPMGHLAQPLNTFWQLFFRPSGATTWSNKVEATATATNGGLVLAAAAGEPFIAGVRPADLLRFSPLISTTDGGSSWSDGLLSQGLARSPDSLSTAAGGPTLALVDGGLEGRVLASSGTLSTWRTLTTARRLASGSGGDACGVQALTAVASLAGNAVVGARCSRPGVVGLFSARQGTWSLDAVAPPPPAWRGGRDQVLGLEETTSGLTALLESSGKSGTALFAAWTVEGARWTLSEPVALASGQHLVSFGPTSGSGLFALSGSGSGPERLVVDAGPGTPWVPMPSPPPGTATVAFGASTAQGADAFAVHGSTVTVWALTNPASGWARGQVVHVAITFGSSS